MISTIMLKYVMPQKIVFFGSGWFVVPVIKTLINHGLAFVVTNESEGEVVEFCKANNIEFVSSNLKDTTVIEKIKSLNPTVAILASYGAFVPDSVISAFPKGIINIHPSLLPAFPGTHTHARALDAGVKTHGCTVHLVTSELDAGPIIAQASVPVLAGDDVATLSARVLVEEHRLYPRVVQDWLAGNFDQRLRELAAREC